MIRLGSKQGAMANAIFLDRAKITDCWQRFRPHLLPCMLLVVATLAVYGRVLGHNFILNWDDNKYVLENQDVQGFSWDRIRVVFSSYYVGNYAPVQMISYMFDHAVWGLWAGGYLLTNLALHVCNGLLLYRLFLRLIGRQAAWIGAALFLLHPVQVESVAWISQRKNLLAMFFFLLAWEFYIVYRDGDVRKKHFFYAASLVTIMLALLSKSAAVIFPMVMVIFDHCYPSEKVHPRFLDKIPYLFVAVAASVLAILSQTPDYSHWGAGGGRSGYYGGGPVATFLTMLPVFCSYIRMIVWPINLSAFYAPAIYQNLNLQVLAALLFLAAIILLICRWYRFDRQIAFWPSVAIVAILPVSQIVPLITLMNDRYLYFPMVGVAGLSACLFRILLGRERWQTVFVASLWIILGALSGLSFQRIAVWKNAETLWSDAVRKSPASPVAWGLLGQALHNSPRPRLAEAASAYRKELELKPDSNICRYNLGLAYTALNDYANADGTFRELLRRSPEDVMGWAAFGDLALRHSDYSEAESRYRKALSLQPDAVQIYQKIGNLQLILGRIGEARTTYLRIEELQKRCDPFNAYELARLEAIAGDTTASLAWLEASLQRGFNNFSGIMGDEELTPVRIDGRFEILLTKYFPK
ncbi:MAG: tetratricopeptide repeat protein [Geobacteraceae bacterium]|nr:tetratricopeptide repeat protein [Geobacteraceae bacterium]